MALKDDIKGLDESIARLEEAAVRLESTFNDIAAELGGIARGSVDFASTIRTAAKDTSDLAKSTSKLRGITKDDLKDKKKANDYAKVAAEVARKRKQTEQTISFLEKARVSASDAERENIDKALQGLYSSIDAANELSSEYGNIVNAAKELNNLTSFFDTLEGVLKTIPGIGPLIAQPFKDAAQAMRETALEGGNFFDIALAAGNELSKSFGPAFFLGSLFKANQETADLGRSLGISAKQARNLRDNFTSIAVNSDKSYVTTKALQEAMTALAAETGVTAGFTNEQLETTLELTKVMGLENAEAAEAFKYSVLTGKSEKQVTTEILDQVTALEAETGIRLDGRAILKEVLKINGQLAANYGFNNELLAEAVVKVKQFGLTLEQAADIANNLLDFESSIANEVEAELLTGRQLNLEQARYLALTGDVAGAASEVRKQVGSAAEFTKLNRIQQESLAAAVGLTVDELANSVREQEILQAVGAENIKQLAEQGRLNELLTVEGGEQLYNQYMQQSAAEKFQGAIEKIQGAIGAIVEGPLGSLLDGIASLATNSFAVYSILGAIGALSLSRAIAGVISLATQLAAAATAAGATSAFLTPGKFLVGLAGIALIAGVLGSAMSQSSESAKMATVDDAISPAGYGDRILSTPRGSVALNNNDTVVAGTNLGGGDTRKADKMIGLLEQLVAKPTNINMDSYRVGTALALV
jgi:archaellum component FlaC